MDSAGVGSKGFVQTGEQPKFERAKSIGCPSDGNSWRPNNASSNTQMNPCHVYVACAFGQGDLGFNAAPAPDGTALLANVICSEIKPNSQAEVRGLQPMDSLVMINNEYVAFLTPTQCLAKLSTAAYARPVNMTFARPNKPEWLRIGESNGGEGEVVKSGELEKQGRFFRRNREFVLTRHNLIYGDDLTGASRKRIPVEEITRVAPVDSNKLEFSFWYQQVETQLRATSKEECMQWVHALETVKRGCFEDVKMSLKRLEPKAATSTTPPTTTTTTTTPTTTTTTTTTPAAKPKVNASPYALLGKSKLSVISSSAPTATGTVATLPPPVLIPHFPTPIDLTLENQLLQKGN
ncbi:hypothetical protein BASA81_006508 [Batrachochytrium salamandrivorans]|nr:hypothetical protein BASA81_006508 [Batrachochytrium salamandrivorans]